MAKKKPQVPVVIGSHPQKATHSVGLAGPGFKPWQPNLTPPLGFYDPVLDANLGAAQRGLGDTQADIGTQQGRLTSDYALGQQDINQSSARSLEDLAAQRAGLVTGHDRTLADIGQQRTYGTEDHTRAVADLQQAFQRKGNQQRQAMSAMGTLHGGAALQAAAKRAANEGHAQQPLDQSFQRLLTGLGTQESQANQDFTTQNGLLDASVARVGQDQAEALGKLALNGAPPDAGNPLGGRAFQDLTTQGTRAQREFTAFGLDTSAAKAAQAAGAGWNPATTKTVRKGGVVYTIDPKGRILAKHKAAA